MMLERPSRFEDRIFHSADVIGALKGVGMALSINGPFRLLGYMTGEDVSVISLARISRECKETLERAFPELVAADLPAQWESFRQHVEWFDNLAEQYGIVVRPPRLDSIDHTAIPPELELRAVIENGKSRPPVVSGEDASAVLTTAVAQGAANPPDVTNLREVSNALREISDSLNRASSATRYFFQGGDRLASLDWAATRVEGERDLLTRVAFTALESPVTPAQSEVVKRLLQNAGKDPGMLAAVAFHTLEKAAGLTDTSAYEVKKALRPDDLDADRLREKFAATLGAVDDSLMVFREIDKRLPALGTDFG